MILGGGRKLGVLWEGARRRPCYGGCARLKGKPRPPRGSEAEPL